MTTLAMVIYGCVALLSAYVIAEAIWTLRVITPDRRASGQPTIGDIFRMRKTELDLKASARMARYEIRSALATGGPAGLDREIRKKFTGVYTHWSIDYKYASYNYAGKKSPGRWANPEGVSESVIWFYNERTPPKPEPKPEHVLRPETTDWDEDRARLEAFKKHPSAFWLNPDWDKARASGQPFWMHDPAPLPEEISPDTDFQQLVEYLIYNDMGFDEGLILQRFGDPHPIALLVLDDRTIQVSRKDFRAAQHKARELRGRSEERINRELRGHSTARVAKGLSDPQREFLRSYY
jgi:hypothetical protein